MPFFRYKRTLWQSGYLNYKYTAAAPAVTFAALWYTTNRPSTPQEGNWTLSCGAFCSPKSIPKLDPHKRVALDCCGEDSFGIAENDYQIVVGVADGVGSWKQKGVDPAKFSQSLMRHLEAIVSGNAEQSESFLGRFGGEKNTLITGAIPPGSIIRQAFWRLVRGYHKGNEKPFGSSTVCVVSLDRQSGMLESANLGDSGFLLLRKGEVVLRSRAQQHRFNAPFQLMLTPEGNVSDCSHMAAIQLTPAEAGDFLIVATDGLWDNLFEEDIVRIVRQSAGDQFTTPTIVAQHLVQEAKKASERTDYESPFCVEARRHGLQRLGGKTDDITVVVAVPQYLQPPIAG